jgi:hypothetical protein
VKIKRQTGSGSSTTVLEQQKSGSGVGGHHFFSLSVTNQPSAGVVTYILTLENLGSTPMAAATTSEVTNRHLAAIEVKK